MKSCFTKKNNVIIAFILSATFSFHNHLYSQWTVQNSGTGSLLSSVYFTDANAGYAAGSGIVLKTTNGGNTWTQAATINFSIQSIFCTDAQNCFIAGSGSPGSGAGRTIAKTTDGGSTWANVYTDPGNVGRLTCVFFVDNITGFAVAETFGISGTNGIILRTTDGGTTWTDVSPSIVNASYFSIFFTDANTGYVGGWDGSFDFVVKTTDGGTTWSENTAAGFFSSMYFTGGSTGYGVGYNGNVKSTTDAGATWQTNGVSGGWLNSIYFTDVNTGYTVGWNGKIFKTTDAGNTWVNEVSPTTNELRSVFFPDANTGYAVGLSGTIVKYSVGGTSGMNEDKNGSEVTVYPNPFSTRAKIKITTTYEIKEWSFIMYDLLGKEIMKNEKIQTGEFILEKNNLLRGIYIYKVRHDKKILETGKLMIE